MARATRKGSRRPPAGLSKIPPRETLASQAADQLRDAIVRGELSTERPLREEELCHKLGISRIPLREALRQLEGEGFIEIRPRRGAVVAALSTDDVMELADMCRVLERRAIELAVPKMTRDVLDHCATLVAELDRVDDPFEWARLNWDFHAALYEPARRPRLVATAAHARANAERYLHVLLADRARRRRLNEEHRRILAACRGGNVKRASQLLDAHLYGGLENVVRIIEKKDELIPTPRQRRR